MQQQQQEQKALEVRAAQLATDITVQQTHIANKQNEIDDHRTKIEDLQKNRITGQDEIRHWQQVHDAQDSQVRQLAIRVAGTECHALKNMPGSSVAWKSAKLWCRVTMTA